MASTVYNFKHYERLSDIASQFSTTIDEIMRVNNVLPPFPVFVSQLPNRITSSGMLIVPVNTNGNQTFESYYHTAEESLGIEFINAEKMKEFEVSNLYNYANLDYFNWVDMRPGRSGKDCYIIVGGTGIAFPCYPDSVSDSNQASYSSVSILGRSEPFQYYTGSGPRTVSTAFQFHTDMCGNVNYVYRIADIIESACYPRYGSAIAATRCHLHIAGNISITGIISSVNTQYSGPIIDNKYAVIDLSFSVTEVTGNPPSQPQIAASGGRR